MNAADAASILGHPGQASRIDLFLDAGADSDAVARKFARLNGQAEVHTPDEDEERVESTMAGMEFGFSLLGAGTLVVGLFLIYLVLSVTWSSGGVRSASCVYSAQRVRQIWGLFVGEAALLGLVGRRRWGVRWAWQRLVTWASVSSKNC